MSGKTLNRCLAGVYRSGEEAPMISVQNQFPRPTMTKQKHKDPPESLGITRITSYNISSCAKAGPLPRGGSAPRSGTGWRSHASRHESPADEGDNQHHCPAGNNAESPKGVCDRHSNAVLGELAIEGMEVPVLLVELALVPAGLVQLQEGVAVGRGQVHALDVDVDGCGGREHLEQPQATGASGPSIAQDGLVVAIDKSNVRGVRQDGELGGCLVKGLLDLQAVAKASLVPTRDQHPPLLGFGGLGLHGRIEGVLPIVQRQDVQLHLADLGLGSSNGVMLAGVWHVGAELAEEVLELCLVLLKLLTLS